jgi:hypothetical protein
MEYTEISRKRDKGRGGEKEDGEVDGGREGESERARD